MPENVSLIESIRSYPPEIIRQAISDLPPEVANALIYDWDFFARRAQLAPRGAWTTWLLKAGRGFGKTRTGAEFVRGQVESKRWGRVALVGPTASDVRDVMVEGESGIMAISPPWFRPKYEPSKRRLTWPSGARATAYSADEPDRLRGPQHDGAWADELAAWRYPEAWDMLLFGLRLGSNPQVVVTTTPRPTKIIKGLIKDASTVVTAGTSYDNKANLAPSFFSQIIAKYENTRLGRQEINGEVLTDNPGALWAQSVIDNTRVKKYPDLKRIVVAIDPSATANEDSDEAGIIAVGIGIDNHGYVLEDGSKVASPQGWAEAAISIYKKLGADRIVAEVNNGGDMVEAVIRMVDPNVSYKAVRASRGKIVRAEPVAALYEQGKVHHVGAFPKLEDQMCEYDPAVSTDSPDRMDALVWALTDLMVTGLPGSGLLDFYSESSKKVES